MTEFDQVVGRLAGQQFVAHGHGDAGASLLGADPRKWDAAFRQQACDLRVLRVRRGDYHPVRLQGGDGRAKFAFDMVAMRIDQFENHPIAELCSGQHAAQQHLVHPVPPVTRFPVRNGAVAVVDGQDQIGTRSAHSLGGDRRNIPELFDTGLNLCLHGRPNIWLVIDDATDRLQGYSCIRCNVFDGD